MHVKSKSRGFVRKKKKEKQKEKEREKESMVVCFASVPDIPTNQASCTENILSIVDDARQWHPSEDRRAQRQNERERFRGALTSRNNRMHLQNV